MTAEDLARRFHETYERLAPSFGYETRKDSAVPWWSVPEKNRKLMVAVCGEVMTAALAARSDARDRELYEQGEELSATRRALLTESEALAAANARIGKEHDALVAAEEALAAARRECKGLRRWMESKAAYYAEDSKELKADAANLVRTDAEAAMFRSGCADYAAGFATELRAALAAPADGEEGTR